MALMLHFHGLRKSFSGEGRTVTALAGVSGSICAGRVTGLVGPDAAGKTTLIRMLAGLLTPDAGTVELEMSDGTGTPDGRISYMPQKFGLYEDLTVAENLTLYADLNGLDEGARAQRFSELHRFTNLGPFADRLAGKLSGGMKQKLGLACTLVVSPDILLLDEPSVGVDPLSRRDLWKMVRALQEIGIAVLWSTAYLDEAERCDEVILLHEGRVLEKGTPATLTARIAGSTWRASFPGNGVRKRDIQRAAADLPGVVDAQIRGRYLHTVMDRPGTAPDFSKLAIAGFRNAAVEPTPARFEDTYLAALRLGSLPTSGAPIIVGPVPDARPNLHILGATGYMPTEAPRLPVIEAVELTRRFGDFTAVDRVSFSVSRGEIFGLLGPNGAGKSTTFKMLCGLLPASGGSARVAGFDLASARADARGHIGYMAQRFAHLGHLTTLQNLTFSGGVYGLSRRALAERIEWTLESYNLAPYRDMASADLPLGIKQKLALACAILHQPEILFLDEPTSGVDPVTRREFWDRINGMADEGVTILITSHFLDEAEFCDRTVIIYRGGIIAAGSPEDIKSAAGPADTTSLEEAFITLVENFDLAHPQ